ncbi:MAG TPA: methyltransferase domain-containing protein [Candidatus Paceibacterota bacterium]
MFSDPIKNLDQFNVDPSMHVADMGAGSGFYTIEAAKRVGSSGRVYAIEVQKDLLPKLKANAAHAHLFNVEVLWGDIEKLGGTRLRDACVDRVIVSNILFQVEHKEDFSKEVRRIIKQNGKILVVDWSEVSPLGPKTLVPEVVAKALFEKAGFIFERTIRAGDHHYGMVFKCK